MLAVSPIYQIPSQPGLLLQTLPQPPEEHDHHVKAADRAAELDERHDPVEQRVGQWNLPAAGHQVAVPLIFSTGPRARTAKTPADSSQNQAEVDTDAAAAAGCSLALALRRCLSCSH